jgi:hypothetical protein
MTEWMTFALLCLTSFFTLINPLGTMPIFVTMTSQLDVTNRNKTAKKAIIVATLTILFFAFSGQLLFLFFGICPLYMNLLARWLRISLPAGYESPCPLFTISLPAVYESPDS